MNIELFLILGTWMHRHSWIPKPRGIFVIPQHKTENIELVSYHGLELFQWMAKQKTAN